MLWDAWPQLAAGRARAIFLAMQLLMTSYFSHCIQLICPDVWSPQDFIDLTADDHMAFPLFLGSLVNVCCGKQPILTHLCHTSPFSRPIGSRFKPVWPWVWSLLNYITQSYSNHKSCYTMKRATRRVQNSIYQHQSYTKIDTNKIFHMK